MNSESIVMYCIMKYLRKQKARYSTSCFFFLSSFVFARFELKLSIEKGARAEKKYYIARDRIHSSSYKGTKPHSNGWFFLFSLPNWNMKLFEKHFHFIPINVKWNGRKKVQIRIKIETHISKDEMWPRSGTGMRGDGISFFWKVFRHTYFLLLISFIGLISIFHAVDRMKEQSINYPK